MLSSPLACLNTRPCAQDLTQLACRLACLFSVPHPLACTTGSWPACAGRHAAQPRGGGRRRGSARGGRAAAAPAAPGPRCRAAPAALPRRSAAAAAARRRAPGVSTSVVNQAGKSAIATLGSRCRALLLCLHAAATAACGWPPVIAMSCWDLFLP